MKTTPLQRIECPNCDKHPYIRDGASKPTLTSRSPTGSDDGIHWHETGREDVECYYSETPVRQHTTASFVVTLTDRHGRPLQWACDCDCGDRWLHEDANAVIGRWSSHVQHVTANA